MRVPRLLLAALASAALLAGANPVAAGNHLRCYKAKDTIAKQKFTGVGLNSNTGLPNVAGCTVSTGTKMCCDAVDKVGVPLTGGPLGPTTKFCCYKLKCPKSTDVTIHINDQFGERDVVSRKAVSKLLCSPSS
jgi:hypothetical protein